MWSQRVAVVTGANKGIGYGIVKGLCQRFDGIVYLTCRDVNRGTAAVSELQKENFKVVFRQLDISDQKSVDAFRDFIKQEHGGLDLLINNAAVFLDPYPGITKVPAEQPLSVLANETIKINYFGTVRVCEALFPLLRHNAKVVNVSSDMGHLYKISSEQLRNEFSKDTLTIPELNKLMEKYLRAVEDNRAEEEGWGSYSYIVSKVALSALTFIQQRTFDKENPNRNISINAVHPGNVQTDMTNQQGVLTFEEGARSTLFVALDADLKGKYVWHDCQIVDWYKDCTPKC